MQRAMRRSSPAQIMADLGFGPVQLVDSFSVSMSGGPHALRLVHGPADLSSLPCHAGSGRSFTAYVFRKGSPVAAPVQSAGHSSAQRQTVLPFRKQGGRPGAPAGADSKAALAAGRSAAVTVQRGSASVQAVATPAQRRAAKPRHSIGELGCKLPEADPAPGPEDVLKLCFPGRLDSHHRCLSCSIHRPLSNGHRCSSGPIAGTFRCSGAAEGYAGGHGSSGGSAIAGTACCSGAAAGHAGGITTQQPDRLGARGISCLELCTFRGWSRDCWQAGAGSLPFQSRSSGQYRPSCCPCTCTCRS